MYARNYTSFTKELWIGRELSIDGRRTVYIWKTDHLFSAYRPSVFLLLELYVFLYCVVNQ